MSDSEKTQEALIQELAALRQQVAALQEENLHYQRSHALLEAQLAELKTVPLSRYKLLSEYSRDIVLYLRSDGQILEANQAAILAYGYERAELLSLNIADLRDPQTQPLLAGQLRQAIEQGVLFETVHQRQDGQLFPVEVSTQSTVIDGETVILSVVRDITDRKRTNALLDTLFNNAPLGIGIWDETLRFFRLNDALAEINGLPQAAHLGKTVAELLPGVEASVTETLRLVIETGESVIGQEASGETPAAPGQLRYWSVTYYPIKLPGDVTWVGAICEEITHRKRAEAERADLLEREKAARAEAEAANRIKDEFLAVLSHELRTPLNPILGWTTLLRSRRLDEKTTAQALEIIERNVRLQAQLIEDLLDISRILQGKLTLNVKPVALPGILQAAIETVRLAAEAKGIRLRLIMDDCGLAEDGSQNSGSQPQPPPFNVLGDAARLQQVAWNLLSNAVKFTPEQGQVTVQLEEQSGYAHISVKDTGKGIVPAFLPYVFDSFRQADSTTTRTFGGLGLGLAIVRHLVELHGGTVGVESQGEGLGTTFTVRLPLHQSQRTTEPTLVAERTLRLDGIRVLVVDDDDDTRTFLAFLLEQAGAIAVTAASAHTALPLLTRTKPDVLISDIGMPGIDGYQLMQQVRRLLPHQGGQIPAIALTAYARESDQQQAIAAGFQLHLPKPIVPEVLIQKVASLCLQ